jgi:hypothetical protein
MNRKFMSIVIASALVLICTYPGVSGERPYLHDLTSLPLQIAEFYEDYNFVASFSTPAEREKIIDNFEREFLPSEIRSERFNQVFRMMKRLYSRMIRFDPKMVIYRGPRKPYIKYFFNSELLEARKIERSDKKAVVEVLSYSVEPEFINRFINQFNEKAGEEGKIPSNEERVKAVKSIVIPKIEFHIWYFQDGAWMKAEHKNIYIKQ